MKLVYQRKDGKWEARYKKGKNQKGKTLYGVIYGDTKEEVIKKRIEFLGYNPDYQIQSPTMNLLILGCGAHGKDIKEIAESLRVFKKIKFLDDNVSIDGEVIGKCGDLTKFRAEFPCAFVAIGDNNIRQKYINYLKQNQFLIPSFVAPTAKISQNSTIGEGVAIMEHCTINDAEIGDYSIIDTGCIVNSEVKIGAYSRIDCGAIVLRGMSLPEKSIVRIGEIYRGETNI